MQRIIFSHIALVCSNLIYAINYIFAKDVMPEYISPSGFILCRIIGACIIFNFTHLIWIKERVLKIDFLYLIICALFGVIINMLCFFEGLSITGPINASLIMITTPLLVYLISCFLSKEERTYSRLIGVVLGLFGAVNLITNGQLAFQPDNFGDVLVFCNALSYAIYLILIKSMMSKYHPITVLKTLFLISAIILIPFTSKEIVISDFQLMPTSIFFKFLFVIIFTTCVAYFFNIYAIINLRASTVAFYIYLQPLLATILSVALGKDVLTWIKLLAALFIFIGVYFVIERRKT